jgi:hypothetical protein
LLDWFACVRFLFVHLVVLLYYNAVIALYYCFFCFMQLHNNWYNKRSRFVNLKYVHFLVHVPTIDTRYIPVYIVASVGVLHALMYHNTVIENGRKYPHIGSETKPSKWFTIRTMAKSSIHSILLFMITIRYFSNIPVLLLLRYYIYTGWHDRSIPFVLLSLDH